MNNGSALSRSPRAGRSNGFFPNSFRAIFRSASSLASTVRSAGTSVATTISSASDDRQREQVQWASFDTLELGPGLSQKVLLLTYLNGFQVWNVEDASDVWELISKRDCPVALLRVQPHPISNECDTDLDAARPLLLLVTNDLMNSRGSGIPSRLPNGYNGVVGSPPSFGENYLGYNILKFYSIRNHTYVRILKFRSAIYSVRCSAQVVAVATASQIYCFDSATLQTTFSVITYPSPPLGPNGLSSGYGPMAVGSRWLAFAPNQPLLPNTGRVSPQHLSPSPGVSPSTSPANGSLVAHYAKESGKQFAAGIVALGDLGYKALSLASQEPGSALQRNSCNHHAEHAGTVHVRDFITKAVVAQFRAHDSPLSALCFDPTGTLLVTASIHGHNINVFRVMPSVNTNGSSHDVTTSHAHLYKLCRGVTNAIIQDITFSEDCHWIVVSSSRGTNHLFCISPFGGMAGPLAHSADVAIEGVAPMHVLPWWCNLGPVKSTQQASSPPPPVVTSSVVSRIKNGNGWRNTVNGAAAVANGRLSGTLGAVSVVFHDGQGQNVDAEANQASLKQQLWALTPSGHLIRYAIRLSGAAEGYHDSVPSADSPKEAMHSRVVVEPLEKWDVSRKPNHLEREEKITDLSVRDLMHQTKSSSVISMASGSDNGREDPTSDEMHRLFLSKAEVQMHHFRPPLWARPQISFHVFDGMGESNDGGEIEIEKFPTRMVEVRKKDLVPVYDRLKTYQFGDDVRERNNLWGNRVSQAGSQSGMIYALIRPDAGGISIQRSSSGSSCGSEGSLGTCSNMLQNSLPHAYQDSFPYHQPRMELKQMHEQNKVEDTDLSTTDLSENHNGKLYTRGGENAHKGDLAELDASDNNADGISNGFLINKGGYEHISLFPKVSALQAERGPSSTASMSSEIDQVSYPASHNVGGSGKFDLQDFDGVTEDMESTEDGNSKSEDFGGEQVEDGWEGAMFPFAEDC